MGLVVAACFAERGSTVICVEQDKKKRASLQGGRCPIHESQLPALLERNVASGRLFFTGSVEEGVLDASFVFLALPTPFSETEGNDLRSLFEVTEFLASLLADWRVASPRIIVNKSTAPVGTARRLQALFREGPSQGGHVVVSNPEFLREGLAVADFMSPHRIVVGTSSLWARSQMENLYAPFTQTGTPLVFMDERSAELTKYACNAFLATKISFANEMAAVCERAGADIEAVSTAMGMDTRIGRDFLAAGIGYGGGCLPKDLRSLTGDAEQMGLNPRVIRAVQQTNQEQILSLSRRAKRYFGSVESRVLAVWGLSFKPGTDDIRESPALANVEWLLREGAVIRAHDPAAVEAVKQRFGDQHGDRLCLCQDPYEAAEAAEALLIMTAWPVYGRPCVDTLKQKMKQRVIFDGRNMYSLQEVSQWDYTYFSVGRRPLGFSDGSA